MKKRVNISIGVELHAQAVAHARRQEMDFSELVSHLLREALRRPTPAVSADASGAAVEQKPAPATSGLPKPGRNAPCPCGSGKKFKRCCEPIWPQLRSASAAGGV